MIATERWLALGLALSSWSCTDERLVTAPSLAVARIDAPAPFDPRFQRARLAVTADVGSISSGTWRLHAKFDIVQGGGIPVVSVTASRLVSSAGSYELASEWDGVDGGGRLLPPDHFQALVTLTLSRADPDELVAELSPVRGKQSLDCRAADGCFEITSCRSALEAPGRCETPRARSHYVCSLLGGFKAPAPESSWNFSGTDDSPPGLLPFASSADDRYPPNVPAGGNPANADNPLVVGSDLGSPFEHRAPDGQTSLVFLFGDTHPLPERAYAHDENGNVFPTGSVFTQSPSTDDAMALSAQDDGDPPTGPERCLDVAFFRGGSELDPIHGVPQSELIEPVTMDGPVVANIAQGSVSGVELRFSRVPGPGFSVGGRMFALMPASNDTSIGIACDANHPCPGSDQCLAIFPEIAGACYYGDCSSVDGTTPCFKRNAPATLATSPGADTKFRSLGSDELDKSADGTVTAVDIYRERSDIVPTVAFFVPDASEVFVWGRERIIGHPQDFGAPSRSGRAELRFWKHPITTTASGPRIGLPRVFAGCEDDPNVCDIPRLSENPSDAVPVYEEDRLIVNQTSVTYLPSFDRWVMIYGGRLPLWTRGRLPSLDAERAMDPYAGVVLRTARHAWGPWSSPITIYNGYWANVSGYCEILFQSQEQRTLLAERVGPGLDVTACDADAPVQLDSSRDPDDFGAEYGTAIVPRFVEDGPDEASFYWVMSTWNPYRVVLMKTTIAKEK